VFTARRSGELDWSPFFYFWTVIGCYRTRNEWMRMWQTYMTMKHPHYISFFRQIQCEWSVPCTWDRTYRESVTQHHQTSYSRALLQRSRYWMRVAQSLFSRTPWFSNEYTHKCLRQCLILFASVSSHVLGCHDVSRLFDLCPSIPYSEPEHVGGARLHFLVLASCKPLLCHLCCLGREKVVFVESYPQNFLKLWSYRVTHKKIFWL